jgi:hypothetical protein
MNDTLNSYSRHNCIRTYRIRNLHHIRFFGPAVVRALETRYPAAEIVRRAHVFAKAGGVGRCCEESGRKEEDTFGSVRGKHDFLSFVSKELLESFSSHLQQRIRMNQYNEWIIYDLMI